MRSARGGAAKDRIRLRLLLAFFFLALAVPTLVLVRHAFDQLELDTFRRYQLLAEEFTRRVDADLAAAVRSEDARSFADYGFLVVSGDPAANFLQPSPLSAFPVGGAVPGLLGYFQVDADGEFSTPLLPRGGDVDPEVYGIASTERARRAAAEERIRAVLAENRLGVAATADRDEVAVAGDPPSLSVSQRELDELLRFGDAPERQVAPTQAPPASLRAARATAESEVESAQARAPSDTDAGSVRLKRVEQTVVPELPERRIRTFESEVDPLQFNRLESGHLVMFRNVWRDGRRTIQGAVIETDVFLGEIGTAFAGTALAAAAGIAVRHRGTELAFVSPRAAAPGNVDAGRGTELLYQTRLSPPLADIELSFFAGPLPPGPGRQLLIWVAVVLAGVLVAGFAVMYRFGLRQIVLAEQQQDFVSAVSHELKTPLTSIRMYGEMLQAGWPDEDKKRTYYTYIYQESERLSRLIENVLQLARMNRSGGRVASTAVQVGELLDIGRSKVATQIERAGFTLQIVTDPGIGGATLQADPDAFAQIMINLVDNAIKFSAGAERKEIEIAARRQGPRVVFGVRDFGPGVRRAEMKKLFELFYRPADELTRSTAGTGIGLGLVRQLAAAMQATVDVRNCAPGAEFRVVFPLTESKD
jgi:signal transduction histidine kinase